MQLPAQKPYWWPEPAHFVVTALIILFACYFDPTDPNMRQVLMTAFVAAYSYAIGSSAGSRRANERADKAIAAISANNGEEGKK